MSVKIGPRLDKKTMEERDARIVQLNQQGVSVQKISLQMGLSRTSIYRILEKKKGIKPPIRFPSLNPY